MRYSNDEIHQKMKEQGCKYTLSWSKLNTFVEDPFSFYLKYVHRIPEEKQNSYAFLGGVVHQGLEDFYAGKKTMDVIIDEFEDKVTEQSFSDINFVRDEKQNKKIEEKYYVCIKHFLKNYQKKSDKSQLEIFAGWKFNDYFMQGYIDHMYPLVEDGKEYLVIEDFKTSTLYTGESIKEKSGQLKLYAYMMHKMYNIPIDRIKIGWNFLKYAGVSIKQKNGTVKESKILRNELPEKLVSKLKVWGKAFKYSEEEIGHFYEILKENNSKYKDVDIFDGIPPEIAENFDVHDCFVEIPLDEKIVTEFINYVNEQIQSMSDKIELFKVTQDEKIFWKEVDKSNSFYFTNLCGYTAKHHLPLREFLEKQSTFENKSNDKIDDDILNFLFKND